MTDSYEPPVIPTLSEVGHSIRFLQERATEIEARTHEYFAIIESIPGVIGNLTGRQVTQIGWFFATRERAAREEGMNTEQSDYPPKEWGGYDLGGLCSGS